MIEILKQLVINQLNNEVEDYNNNLQELKNMEEKIRTDDSEKKYNQKIKELKNNYGIKRFYKRKIKKEYKDELNNINKEYFDNLKQFKDFYDEYEILRKKLAKCDIYRIKKQLENIPNYSKIKDFRLNYTDAINLLKENGVYNSLTEEELQELKKLQKNR